jgi:hypothetical protein
MVSGNQWIIQAVCVAKFNDDTSWTGTGDATMRTVDKEYGKYPTAVAESRAEARALKKALGIRLLAAEEVTKDDLKGVSANSRIPDQTIKAINRVIERNGTDLIEAIKEALGRDDVADVADLSQAEGGKLLKYLNEIKTSTRDRRKKELKERINAK